MAKKKEIIEKEINLQELSDWSGESSVRKIKYSVPILKFNGNSGKFSLLVPDDRGAWVAEPIENKLELVVLKVRRVLSSYEKAPDGSGIRVFTNEHNSWKDPLIVFESKKGEKFRMLDAGDSKHVRQNFPTLRLRENLYCLMKDQVVKLSVHGKSLSALFEYYNQFKAEEHIFQFYTKLSCHDETNEGGLTYFVLDWEKGDQSDLGIVADKIKEVRDALAFQDRQYAESSIPEEDRGPLPETPLPPGNGTEIPESDEVIEIGDLPL